MSDWNAIEIEGENGEEYLVLGRRAGTATGERILKNNYMSEEMVRRDSHLRYTVEDALQDFDEFIYPENPGPEDNILIFQKNASNPTEQSNQTQSKVTLPRNYDLDLPIPSVDILEDQNNTSTSTQNPTTKKGGDNMTDDRIEAKRDELKRAVEDLEDDRQSLNDQYSDTGGAVSDLVSQADELVEKYGDTRDHAAEVYDRAIRLASEVANTYQDLEDCFEDLEEDARDAKGDWTDYGEMPSLDPVDDALDNFGG